MGVFDTQLEDTGETLYLVDERHYPEEEDDENNPAYIEEDYILTWLHASHFIMGEKDVYSKVVAHLCGDERYLICRFPSGDVIKRGSGLKAKDEAKIMEQVMRRTIDIWYRTAAEHSLVYLQTYKISNGKTRLTFNLHLAKFAKESDPTNLTNVIDPSGYVILYVFFEGKNTYANGVVEIRKKIGYDVYIVQQANDVDPLKWCAKLSKAKQELLMNYITSVSKKIDKMAKIIDEGNSEKDEREIWHSLTDDASATDENEKEQ